MGIYTSKDFKNKASDFTANYAERMIKAGLSKNDMVSLADSIIRVFGEHYGVELTPEQKEIVKGEFIFHVVDKG